MTTRRICAVCNKHIEDPEATYLCRDCVADVQKKPDTPASTPSKHADTQLHPEAP